MSQQIIQTTDFKTGSVVHNIQGVLYRGEGSPLGQRTSSQIGALYIDIVSGNLWLATSTSLNTGWQPFYGQLTSNITISSDVQEGDLIGLYGAGSWAASGTLNTTRYDLAGSGSQNASFIAGGANGSNVVQITSELFNGSIWSNSGNMNTSRYLTAASGSQNAGLVIAGFNASSVIQITSELFNGSIWSNSGNLNISRQSLAGLGTQNAALGIAGQNTSTTVQLSTESFNGSTWSTSVNLNTSRQIMGAAGSQNAGLVFGGKNASATTQITSEIYNGSSWSLSGVLITSRDSLGGAGTQNAGLAIAGETLAAANLSSTEIFNGITWSASGNLSISVIDSTGTGTQSAGVAAGGIAGGQTNATSLHSQTTYRRLNYTSLPSTGNIGMAINVSTTANTATLCEGDIPNTRLAGQNFFGFNKYTQEQSNITLETTRNITSITASGQTAIITTSSNTAIANGMLLSIANASNTNNNGLFPVTSFSGGTQITVKNANAVTQASATGTVQLVYANRMAGLTTSSITVSGNSAVITFSSAGGLSASQFQRLVKVGGNIYIPFATTSGATGSQFNWGTYRITAVGSLTITVTTLNAEAITETIACTAVEYWAQCFTETTIPQHSYIMGFNNRLGLFQKPMTDASGNY